MLTQQIEFVIWEYLTKGSQPYNSYDKEGQAINRQYRSELEIKKLVYYESLMMRF